MRRFLIAILRASLAAISGLGVAFGWWYLWMYHGLIGTPKLLHKVWPGVVDGERSYDVTLFEMWLLSGIVVFVLLGPLARRFKHRNEGYV